MAQQSLAPPEPVISDALHDDDILSEKDAGTKINNQQFMCNLKRLQELRTFLIQEAIFKSDGGTLASESLNRLQYNPQGREPSSGEWDELEFLTQKLFGLLSDPLSRRFVLGEIPRWVAFLPILLAFVALTSLLVAVGSPNKFILSESCYLFWLMSLGAIGSVAFIGMNVLSVQEDITFDLSNRNLMILRITLGALFGLVLTLPFGITGLNKFLEAGGMTTGSTPTDSSKFSSEALLLLVPFVLGFSTSVVIVILNRLVDSVQAFFGRPSTQAKVGTSSGPTPTP